MVVLDVPTVDILNVTNMSKEDLFYILRVLENNPELILGIRDNFISANIQDFYFFIGVSDALEATLTIGDHKYYCAISKEELIRIKELISKLDKLHANYSYNNIINLLEDYENSLDSTNHRKSI